MFLPPPPESSSLRWRVRAGALALAAAAWLGCAGGEAPWDVRTGDELRFQRAERECRMLTRDPAGNAGPIPFDRCMNRRGFERMGPIERLWKGA
jgi:hypothetical protein